MTTPRVCRIVAEGRKRRCSLSLSAYHLKSRSQVARRLSIVLLLRDVVRNAPAPSMRYESNPKHSDPWQRGRRGARCPPDIDAAQAQQLLSTSVSDGNKRYAVSEDRAF